MIGCIRQSAFWLVVATMTLGGGSIATADPSPWGGSAAVEKPPPSGHARGDSMCAAGWTPSPATLGEADNGGAYTCSISGTGAGTNPTCGDSAGYTVQPTYKTVGASQNNLGHVENLPPISIQNGRAIYSCWNAQIMASKLK
jgi:hypothetical protein